jgi:peptidoglycan/LPS O-acetylase OafA/YrhL
MAGSGAFFVISSRIIGRGFLHGDPAAIDELRHGTMYIFSGLRISIREENRHEETSFMQPATPSASRYYRPELDVVRFIAFLLVFLHHTLPSTEDPRVAHLLRGFAPAFDAFSDACSFGLSLFFTLSAFLICELLLREREKTGEISVKQFYIRRILRIWPLYYLGLAIGVIFALLPSGETGDMTRIGWFALFMGSWYGATHVPFALPITPLWSISVEEQFYLFAPWVLKYFNRKSLYGFCAALILLSNFWLYFLGRVSATSRGIWFNAFVQYECFAGGILLCLFLRGRLPRLAAWQRMVLLAFSFSCWLNACYELHPIFDRAGERNPGCLPLIGGYALGTLGCVLLLVAFLGANAKLLPGWAIYLGRISFGLYVFHDFAIYITNHLIIQNLSAHMNPLIKSLEGPIFLLNVGLTLGLTILMAALSYRYFETPFLKMKKRHSVIQSQPIQGAG